MVYTIKFNPREYLGKEDGRCLIRVVRAVLDFSGHESYYYQVIKDLLSGKFGYDFIEIATNLAEANLLLEFGLYDTDFIPVPKVGEKIDVIKLDSLFSQTANFRKCDLESLESIVKFASRYAALLKIKRSNFGELKKMLINGYPICVHIRLGTLYNTDCEVIHAQVVYGFDDELRKIYVWDPDVGFLEYKTSTYIFAWWEAGGYYLTVKKKSGDNS